MQFLNMEALQAFRDDEGLIKRRKEAGDVIESSVIKLIPDGYFTNYPVAYLQHRMVG